MPLVVSCPPPAPKEMTPCHQIVPSESTAYTRPSDPGSRTDITKKFLPFKFLICGFLWCLSVTSNFVVLNALMLCLCVCLNFDASTELNSNIEHANK